MLSGCKRCAFHERDEMEGADAWCSKEMNWTTNAFRFWRAPRLELGVGWKTDGKLEMVDALR